MYRSKCEKKERLITRVLKQFSNDENSRKTIVFGDTQTDEMSTRRKTSISLPVDHSNFHKDVVSAQTLLQMSPNIAKFGFLKFKEKHFGAGKWTQRFVVVTNDRIYVYQNETSNSPKVSIALLGYRGLCRYTSKSKSHAPWGFAIVPAWTLLASYKFSTVSEKSRLEWMSTIKKSLFGANCIECPVDTVYDRMSSLQSTDDIANAESWYEILEDPVFSCNPGVSKESDEIDDNDGDPDDDDDEDYDGEDLYQEIDEKPKVNKARPSMRISTGSKSSSASECRSSDSNSIKYHDEESSDEEPEYLEPKSRLKKRRPSDPFVGMKTTDEPDYQNLEVIRQEMENLYKTPKPVVSLETMCTVVDSNLTREELLTRLRTKPTGTYLIRKSRTDNQNVLAVHCGNGATGEYKIFQRDDKQVSLDKEEWFDHIDEMLRMYTVSLSLPKRQNEYLGMGFHRNSMDQIPEEEEGELYVVIPDSD